MSHHALERALDMQLTPEQIRHCLTRPEAVEPCRQRPGFTLYQHGQITCSVSEDNTVATILWRYPAGWRKDMKNRPAYTGRDYRGETA